MNHTISYSNINSLEAVDIFHEMCKARLDELGYTTIENAALNAIRDCCKNDPKYIRDANSAVAIISEVYTNALLFSHFLQESEGKRDEMFRKFTSSTALASLYLQMDFWGIAGVSYYKTASDIAKTPFPKSQVEKAIEQCENKAVAKDYNVINALLSQLPEISNTTTPISDTKSINIISVIVELFSTKTGLDC